MNCVNVGLVLKVLKKEPNHIYQVLHQGNNEETLKLAVGMFDETTTCVVSSYFLGQVRPINIPYHYQCLVDNSKY